MKIAFHGSGENLFANFINEESGCKLCMPTPKYSRNLNSFLANGIGSKKNTKKHL
jgi:hypothetical protein